MKTTDYHKLKLELSGPVARIAFDNPGTLNAFDTAMQQDLVRILLELSFRPDIHVINLTGEGRAFSAGGDLAVAAKVRDNVRVLAGEMAMARRTVSAFLDCEQIIIARVNGDAVGLGATLALLSDIVVAADTARIGDPHVRAGLVAGDGGAFLWPHLIGYARAKRYLLTGDLIPAPEAVEMGLIAEAVPAGELDARVDHWISRLTRGAMQATKWTKLAINGGLKQAAVAVMDAGTGHEGMSLYGEELQEAASAFLEKRKPKFGHDE